MLEHMTIGHLSLLVGIYGWMGIIFKWNFFWNNRKAKFMILTCGEGGARWFYGILSSIFMIFGISTMI